jgi:transglutaminase-like putative cysteine protease
MVRPMQSTALRIRHTTTYRYNRLVSLLPHHLMLRPRENHNLRITSMSVIVTPDATLSWANDVANNTIATATFPLMADTLVIDSSVDLQLDAEPWPIFDIATSAMSYPFLYSDDEWSDLGALASQQYADPDGRLHNWALAFVHNRPTDTLSLLKEINVNIAAWVFYQSRDDEGTQTPIQTLDRGWGSCRDIAVLFLEAVRSLGFGARIVSGYLYNPDNDYGGYAAMGASTHAWAEVYVPGAGWITFDPTNRRFGNFNLIPVAVGRDIRHVMPIVGSFVGMNDAFEGMTVDVRVTS